MEKILNDNLYFLLNNQVNIALATITINIVLTPFGVKNVH